MGAQVELYVEGDWANPQYIGQAPDITGLSFYQSVNGGTPTLIDPEYIEVHPSTYTVLGVQTVNFNTAAGSTSKSVTVVAVPAAKKYLDTFGLTTYDQNIKNYIDGIVETDIAPAIDAKADDSVFGASGSGHDKGLVPDPGATAGTTKFLREDGTWAVPAGGSGGGGGGDTNIIESISVNNVAQTVDANKNVNITVPTIATAIADNDSGYATGDQVYDYVQANKGDTNIIESISVNNTAQTVTAKNVNITVPVLDVQTSTDGSTYATTVDANKIAKIDLSGYAETSDIPAPAQAMADGDMGYVTGDMLYDIIGDLEDFLENY